MGSAACAGNSSPLAALPSSTLAKGPACGGGDLHLHLQQRETQFGAQARRPTPAARGCPATSRAASLRGCPSSSSSGARTTTPACTCRAFSACLQFLARSKALAAVARDPFARPLRGDGAVVLQHPAGRRQRRPGRQRVFQREGHHQDEDGRHQEQHGQPVRVAQQQPPFLGGEAQDLVCRRRIEADMSVAQRAMGVVHEQRLEVVERRSVRVAAQQRRAGRRSASTRP